MSVCFTPQSSFVPFNQIFPQPYGQAGQQLPLVTLSPLGPQRPWAPTPEYCAAGQQQISDLARQAAYVLAASLAECARWIVPVVESNLSPHLGAREIDSKMNLLGNQQVAANWSNGTGIPQTPINAQHVPTFAAMGV
ncbi:hypothetical protein ACIQU6_43900 [Streptomyces sp. NPDC090442]|uniref:hypothetical protein n=1 Tax=Streptomyces sp. NPDC090442 TaxID=3365962 RepID=UPI0037FC8846